MNPLIPHKSVLIIRNNIISVLSLSIKNILEKSCFQDTLDDMSIEVNNFLTIFEHVIYFCVKGNGLMLSSKMKLHPWKLFMENCQSIPHNCIPTIYQIDNISTNFGKIRALIRMSLIEKRLHEYLLSAFNDKKLNNKLYAPDSVILSGHLPNIINEIIGLSAVNFSFDLKLDFNHPGFYPIDYSPFLKFYQSPQSVLDDLSECDFQNGQDHCCHWKVKYENIFSKAKLESKQKGYLEEVLLNQETKTSALERRNTILDAEVKNLEMAVTDLQIQLTLLHEQYSKEIEKLGGVSTNLNVPSVKSTVGSRAEIMSERHPVSISISQIESDKFMNSGKGDHLTTPLLQVVPFAFHGIVRESYNKLSKMASSTGDLRNKNNHHNSMTNNHSKDVNENSITPIAFTVGQQLMTDITKHYCSPSNENNRRLTKNSIFNNNYKTTITESCSDYTSRLFDIALEQQRTRIMESQELRKIMVKASRSPRIKAHQHAKFIDVSKSLSFDLSDNYSLDESMSDDAMDSRSRIIDKKTKFDHIYDCTNSHNNEPLPNKNTFSVINNSYPINSTNYYYLSNVPASEQLTENNYFHIESDIAIDSIHPDSERYYANENIYLLSPAPDIIELPPLVTAEVPHNIEPLTNPLETFGSAENFVNGDRNSRGLNGH